MQNAVAIIFFAPRDFAERRQQKEPASAQKCTPNMKSKKVQAALSILVKNALSIQAKMALSKKAKNHYKSHTKRPKTALSNLTKTHYQNYSFWVNRITQNMHNKNSKMPHRNTQKDPTQIVRNTRPNIFFFAQVNIFYS